MATNGKSWFINVHNPQTRLKFRQWVDPLLKQAQDWSTADLSEHPIGNNELASASTVYISVH